MTESGEIAALPKRRRLTFIGPKGAYGYSRRRWAFHRWVNGFCQVIDGVVNIVTFGYWGSDLTFRHIAKVARDGCRSQRVRADIGRNVEGRCPSCLSTNGHLSNCDWPER